VDHDKNEAAQEFMEEIVDDLGHTPKGGKNEVSGPAGHPGPAPKRPIFAGIGIGALIAGIAFFLIGGNGDHTEEIAGLKADLNRLREQVAALDRPETQTQVSRIEDLKGFQQLENRISRLEKEKNRLQQEIKRFADRSTASPVKKSSSQDTQRYHTVQAGDSLYSIAKRYDMSVDTLCRLNRITRHQPIHPGQNLLVNE